MKRETKALRKMKRVPNEKCFRSSPDTTNAKDHSLYFSMKLCVCAPHNKTNKHKNEKEKV